MLNSISHRLATRRTRNAVRGFSLIELLVVLGIIATLIAILLPALAGIRRQSQKTVCKAQLQQIGIAFRLFTDQNKDRYPRCPSLPSVNPNGYPTLVEQLGQNLNNDPRIWRCPSDEKLYPTENTSYFYYNEVGERPLRQTFLWKIYQDVTRVPILWDADSYHGGNVPFNWLFVDGHVDQFLKPDTSGSGS